MGDNQCLIPEIESESGPTEGGVGFCSVGGRGFGVRVRFGMGLWELECRMGVI